MTRLAYLLLSGAILVCAFVLSPAIESQGERSPRSPVPLSFEGATPVPVVLRESPARSAPSIPLQWSPDWSDLVPVGSTRRASDSQTMGSGKLDVALDAGDGGEVAGAPDEEPDNPSDTPADEDPFAGIGEDDDGEPVDEWATMTATERAQAAQRFLEDDTDEPSDSLDGGQPDEPSDVPPEEDPFAGIGEDDDAEPVDEWAGMTPEERAAAQQRILQGEGEPADDPRDDEPEDEEPDDPRDEGADEPFSVLSYTLEDVPPATPLQAYDPFEEAPADSFPPEEGVDPTDAPRTLTPGIYVHSVFPNDADFEPEDPTLGSVILGQPFHISVAVPAGQADKNGDGVVEDLTITLATEDGETEVTLAHDPLQDTMDGVFVYRTGKPVSLAGKSQGIDVDGTVSGLDLDSYEGSKTVTISVDGQHFNAIDVYTNNTQRGLGMISEGLDGVSNVLVAEIKTIRQIRSSPGVAGNAQLTAELDAWQTRVNDRMAVVQRARTLLANPDQLPIVKLKVGQFYFERLIARDENGQFAVADGIVPFSVVADANMYTDFVRMDDYAKVRENVIRDELMRGVIEEVLPAYLVGIYDQMNTWNVPGAFLWTLGESLGREATQSESSVWGVFTGEGTDHLGRKKTVRYAALEMGAFVAFIKLPDALTDWAAGGFGVPSIGMPRFRGNSLTGNVIVPKGPGRLARDTQLGTQPLPGTGGRLSLSERAWWQERAAARAPVSYFDEIMATTSRELDELDNIVLGAQQKGVPRSDIEAAIANARMRHGFGSDPVQNIRNAIANVRQELVIRAANAEGRTIVVHPTEMQEFRLFARDAPTPGVRQEDLLMIAGIKARAEFEARHGGKPMYSPDEVELARRLLTHGDDLKNWLEFNDREGGLLHLFDDAAIGDLRTVFGGGGPPAQRIAANRGFQRIEDRGVRTQTPADQAPTNPFDSQGRTPDLPGQAGRGQAGRPPTQELSPGEMEQAILNAETVRLGRPSNAQLGAQVARQLATLQEYQALVARQAAGERLDLGQIARPGIARVVNGRVMVQQGSGRWENTRPDEWLDVFIDARATLPEGAVVIQRGVSPELVRQANLLSSRGQAGSNPSIVNAATSDIPAFVRVRVRARDADAPMSDVRNAIDNELARLESEGVDLASLRSAMDPLSPNERLALLRNDAARAQAVQTGVTPTPSTPAAAPPRMSELDQQVIQKAFRHGRGENVEWTPEELTRLQQIAYPPSGNRPSAIQRRLMPVAEQLGGQMKTQRQDARTFGEGLDQANEVYLAYQEMDDLIDLARRVGVPQERIRLQTEGLGESTPVTALERASRGLLREIDQARGIIRESGVPDDFFIVTRMYVVAKANQNRLTSGDVAWLRERLESDPDFIRNLSRREFDDMLGESHTIMEPPGAHDLQRMFEAATGGTPGTPISQTSTGTINLATTTGAAMLGGPSGRGGATAPVEVVILSTEGSTGAVMEAFFLNRGKPVQIQGEGIVLEPVADVDAATMQRIEQIREAALQGKPVPPAGAGSRGAGPMEEPWAGASVVRVVLDAYCLEADLAVPTQGMLFRIADPARQAAFGNLQGILEASQQLRERGALHPSNNPDDYFHSIRQWAVWVDEKDMDDGEFEDAFVDHAEKNVTAAGQPWNEDVEQVVRDYAPGRWRDIEAVLKLAGLR